MPIYTTGCLSGTTAKTEATPPPVALNPDAIETEPAPPASLANLHLSLAKPSYNLNEPILLDTVGKFNLLVPYA
jgi:hypothetical protein